MNKETNSTYIGAWLNRHVEFTHVEFENVKTSLVSSIQENGFKSVETKESEYIFEITAYLGSKLKAFLVGLIPFGYHLASGKRLKLTASIIKENCIKTNIKIVPMMELFDEEEILGVSQSMDEKVTDEYFGVKKIHSILSAIYLKLGIELPSELVEINLKKYAKDSASNILIHPLETSNYRKTIHKPSEPGPIWCWGGFILPEIWFIWNEIWGVSMLAVIPTALYMQATEMEAKPIVVKGLLALIIATRILLGFNGNRIYYAKHGHWPNKKTV